MHNGTNIFQKLHIILYRDFENLIFSQSWIYLHKNDRKHLEKKRVFITEMQMRIHKFFEPIVIF